jgi:hypothetical protein
MLTKSVTALEPCPRVQGSSHKRHVCVTGLPGQLLFADVVFAVWSRQTPVDGKSSVVCLLE